AVIERLKNDPAVSILYVGERITPGFFIPPVIVETSDPNHWVMQDELFGPIIALFSVADLDHALMVANGVKYALTGALFSRSPRNIERARKNFQVGNLYINQKCTGAEVMRQPFGGFKMSGTGIKAGGPHYLLNFVDSRAISENTMRRGFAPES
ncbi:MAG TPA: aldehyde dehydrogenase family protein, partial [Myxococcota bacterium]|nr:aldehyde dehydrogenase family protein [Myxococcota bacterium]